MITRDDYVSGRNTHDEYYSQFIGDLAVSYVVNTIGKKLIESSTDEHMNNIPLSMWDRLQMHLLINRDFWRSANLHDNKSTFPWSASDNVCLAKAAAQIHKEKQSRADK
jgi:hypothetical protein